MSSNIKNTPEYQELSLKYKLALRYIRNKTNQLLDVLGTMPFLADNITDDELLSTDPIGIVSDTFASVLDNLRETNNKLKNAAAEIEAILNATPAGIIIIDASSKTIVSANPAAAEIIGLNVDKIIGKGCCDFFCTSGKKACPIIDNNQVISKAERPMIDAKGELKTILKSVKPIYMKGKLHFVESFIDITENKKMLQELIKSQRIESLSLLAGGIAHDFNNALMAILGNISLAKNMLPENDRVYSRLSKAEDAVQKAQALSTQLLTFSKGGAPVLKRASIGDLLTETVKFAASGKSIKVSFDIDNALPMLNIDEVQISQVFQNLTINAAEAMPQGGNLFVSANCTTDVNFANRISEVNKFIKITFRDTGDGIKPELIDKIFDPFFTTKKTGSGLGLATSYSIIKKHDGHITVKSSEKGTEFTIYLPVKLDEKENIDIQPNAYVNIDENLYVPSEVNTQNFKGRILILEDEESVSAVIKDMFSIFDYDAEICTSGQELIAKYTSNLNLDNKFDFVILDLTVPGGMGGIETFQRLKEIDPRVKAIMSSGYDIGQMQQDAVKYGFIDCIGKPFKIDKIKEIISKIESSM